MGDDVYKTMDSLRYFLRQFSSSNVLYELSDGNIK